MASPNFIQVPPDSTGKEIEANSPNTDGKGNPVFRQVITIADANTAANVLQITGNNEALVSVNSINVPITVEQPLGADLHVNVDNLTPVPFGQTVMSNSVPVVIASNQSPVEVIEQGASNLNTNQVNIGNTATVIVNSRATRRAVLIGLVGSAPTDVYIGPVGVSSATGFPLYGVKGAAISINTDGAVYGICSSSQEVAYLEVYD